MKIPKYRRHSTRDLGFVEWKRRKRYFPGKYNSQESIKAYKQFLIDHVGVAEVAQAVVKKTDYTVAVLCRDFLMQLLVQCKYDRRGVYGNYRAALKPFAGAFGNEQAESIGPLVLKKWIATLAERKLARLYINQCLFYIQQTFRWAASEELIGASVWHGLRSVQSLRPGRTIAKEPKKRRPVPWSYIELLLPHLTRNLQAMVQLQFHTGARSQSICRACPAQFEWDGDLLLWRPRHKTENRSKEELILPLGPKAQAAIAPFLNGPADKPIFSPRTVRPNKRFHERYSSETYRDGLVNVQKRLNERLADSCCPPLPLWSPHQLRHAKGHIVRRLYGVEAAQAALGHDSLSSTQIYSARRLDLAKIVARETG